MARTLRPPTCVSFSQASNSRPLCHGPTPQHLQPASGSTINAEFAQSYKQVVSSVWFSRANVDIESPSAHAWLAARLRELEPVLLRIWSVSQHRYLRGVRPHYQFLQRTYSWLHRPWLWPYYWCLCTWGAMYLSFPFFDFSTWFWLQRVDAWYM